MRTSRSLWAVAAAAATVSLALTGCAPGSASAPAEAGDGGEMTGTITIWHGLTGATLEVLEDYTAKFEDEHEGAHVELVNPGDLRQKVQASLVSGGLPDAFQWFGGGQMKPLVDAGALRPIDDYVAASPEWSADMIDLWAENYTFDGKTYAAPIDAPTSQLFYNKAIFEEAGIAAPPETWDEFIDDVALLKAAGKTPITVAAMDGYPLQMWFTYLAQRNIGWEKLNEAIAGNGDWTDPAYVDAAAKLKQLVDAGGFAEGYLGEGWELANARYYSGDAAMQLGGSWFLGDVNNPDNNAPLDETSSFPFPSTGGAGEQSEIQGGPNGAWTISTESEHADLTWEFIKGFTSPENASAYATKTLQQSPTKIEWDESAVPQLYNDFTNAMSTYTGFTMFINNELPAVQNTEFVNLMNSLVTGAITPEEMMAKFQEFVVANPE